MLAIGLHFAGKRKDSDDFFRAGRRIPWWAAGLSIYATMLSSLTFMAVPAKAYATDWGFFLNFFSILLLAPLVIRLYLPFFRQLDVTSAYEYLERRFNLAARLFGSASFMIFQVGRTGIVLYLPALALATVSNLDVNACIIGMGVLTILLTVFGGMEAVIWTDVAQSVILLAAALLALGFILLRLDDGPRDVFAVAEAGGKFFSGLSWSLDLTLATGWVLFFGQFFTNLISYTSNQEVVQRYLTTVDESQAARAIWANALISLPSGLLFFALGTALWVFYKQQPWGLDPTLDRSDAIFPYFMVHELPPGVAGFVVAGIFAAAQPTSGLNSTATAFVTDVYARFVPSASDRACLRAGRVVTVATGILGITAALLLARYPVESLWELFLNVLGLTTGMLAGLFALGILTRRASGAGALLGVVATAAVLYLVHRHTRLYPLLYGGVAVLTCFVAGYALSLLVPAGRKPLDGLTIHTMRR
jgi:SSS family transporter